MSNTFESDRMSLREFQRLYLDEDMHHSSGWFADPKASLDVAQVQKSLRLADALEIEPGMKVLDVGCSWGAFAQWIAAQGADVTGLTVDPEHAAWAPRTPNLNIVVQRWQDYTGTVDRVVCINALENFDERSAFFHKLRDWLKPGGQAVIWSVTADSSIYRAPSLSDVLGWADDARLEVMWLAPDLAHHYAATLACFVSNLESAYIPPQDQASLEMRNRRLRFYKTSRTLLETGRNNMVEIGLRRVD
ncbi:SAM-dependent methyltransferase [Promicromonospora sp. NPDC057488]|uniref:SAM-dependent methyltransferase n=1 Tax=Promicromonospora sp. NPDC057488 TaxID=3346147 RepID=UPI00366CCA56